MSPFPAPVSSPENVVRGGQRLAQTDPLVNYRYATDPLRSCATCVSYEAPGGCALVTGMIRPVDVCDLWEENPHGRSGAVQAVLVGREKFRNLPDGAAGPAPRHSRGPVEQERSASTPVQARFARPEPVQARWKETTPPGYERIVKTLKRQPDVANPWAVAWSMKRRGIGPKEAGEAAPGSAATGLLRKTTVRATLKDRQRHTSDLDIPERAFKADLKRKVALKHLMHPKKAAEVGTSQGAKKGWETRKRGGGTTPAPLAPSGSGPSRKTLPPRGGGSTPPTIQDLARALKSGPGRAERAANMAANDAYDASLAKSTRGSRRGEPPGLARARAQAAANAAYMKALRLVSRSPLDRDLPASLEPRGQ